MRVVKPRKVPLRPESRLLGQALFVAWLSCAGLASGQDQSELLARWSSISNSIQQFPFALAGQSAPCKPPAWDWAAADFQGVARECDRALRLAAKETVMPLWIPVFKWKKTALHFLNPWLCESFESGCGAGREGAEGSRFRAGPPALCRSLDHSKGISRSRRVGPNHQRHADPAVRLVPFAYAQVG